MDIFCPACGKKGRIDDAKIPDSGTFARCPGCRKRLWIHKTDGVNLAEEPSTGTTSQSTGDPASTPAAEPPQGAAATPTPVTTPAPAPPPQAEPPQQEPVHVPGPDVAAGFDVSPLPDAREPAGEHQPPEEAGALIQCSLCQNTFPDTDMVSFGDTKVCAACKPRYVQMMRTGVSAQGAFAYGGFWIRFVAKIIDGLILGIAQGIFMVPMYMFVFRSVSSGPSPEFMSTMITANMFIQLLSVALGAGYTTFFIGKYQATPGKMAFGLKVVAPDGDKISYLRAFGRHFAEMVSAFMLAIGYIMAAFDSQKRSLHDRICDTRVIRN